MSFFFVPNKKWSAYDILRMRSIFSYYRLLSRSTSAVRSSAVSA